MGAVEHLKTLCCLGLPPESAMVAVVRYAILPNGELAIYTVRSPLPPDLWHALHGSYPRRGAHDGQGRRLQRSQHAAIPALVTRLGGPGPAKVRIAAGALRAGTGD
jgi:hypothetical protein